MRQEAQVSQEMEEEHAEPDSKKTKAVKEVLLTDDQEDALMEWIRD